MADTIRSQIDLITNLLEPGQYRTLSSQYIRDSVVSAFGTFATTQAGSWTAALADIGTTVRMASASANNFLIPTDVAVAVPVGSRIHVRRVGAGVITVAAVTPGTTTLTSAAAPGAVSFTIRAVGSLITVTKDAPNLWYVDGDLEMDLPVTIVPLDVSTVTTGGVAVTAFNAGNRKKGGYITNPPDAPDNLVINELTTASGIVTAGSNFVIMPGGTQILAPSLLGVSVISATSSHVFAGQGRT